MLTTQRVSNHNRKQRKVLKKKAVKDRGRKMVSQVTATGSAGSLFWVLLPTRDARQRGQMSEVITVRPDKLQLAISYCWEARGQAGAKTMPTPLCDDQCLRRLCKMAAAKPTHYYESLALHFQPRPSSSCSSSSSSCSSPPLKGSAICEWQRGLGHLFWMQ